MSGGAYAPGAIEARWQALWEAEGAFAASSHPEGPTCFVLVFPPYPNGRIHMGHVRSYAIGDCLARFERLRGKSVLHPIGFDAFGLPNEIEAGKRGVDPETLTRENVAAMSRQLRRLGFSYDWRRAIVTIDPEYYSWNQWLFLRLLERGLAYRKSARVRWCPGCRTSLANEQVLDERCWRCTTPIVSRHLPQWFVKLRAYAGETWEETYRGVYPDHVAAMLRDWLGRADGALLRFPVVAGDEALPVFTTKPELTHGATYLALAPEHPLAAALVAGSGREEDLDSLLALVRGSEDPGALVDGLDTGRRAIHPLTGEAIPIWLAAYVDPDFATGAVVGNPCHDRRDHAFGRAHGVPGRAVVSPDGSPWDWEARGPFLDDGVIYGVPGFRGRPSAAARGEVIEDWKARGLGEATTFYAIRDWCVSRQRGWGTPIPIVHCGECGTVPVRAAELPVRLPPRLRDLGHGNPLEHCPEFLACPCPGCGRNAQRESDTLDTFLDTTWYFLRSMNPGYRESLCDPAAVSRWGCADLYVGGIEIAVPIALYGGFIAKALRDAGMIPFSVPFRRLLAHDMVLSRGRKMSKSLGNAVEPEGIVENVGADALRLLVLSLAPPLKKIEWSESRLEGCRRFLARVYEIGRRHAVRAFPGAEERSEDHREARLRRRAREAAARVTRDMEKLQPNTCITELIKLLRDLEEAESTRCADGGALGEQPEFLEALRTLVVLLAPFAPHLCEEIWERIGPGTRLSERPLAAAAAGRFAGRQGLDRDPGGRDDGDAHGGLRGPLRRGGDGTGALEPGGEREDLPADDREDDSRPRPSRQLRDLSGQQDSAGERSRGGGSRPFLSSSFPALRGAEHGGSEAMRRFVRFAVGGVVLTLLAGALPAMGAEGRIPIWQPVDINQSGKYIVTRNITNPADAVIKVSGGSVDIDLNGMTLTSGGGLGTIDVSTASKLVLRNGSVSAQSGDGVRVWNAGQVVLEDLTVLAAAANGISVRAGFHMSPGFALRRNVIREVGGVGIRIDGGDP